MKLTERLYILCVLSLAVSVSGLGLAPQTQSPAIYLPLVTKNFRPGYSNPFGITIYSGVDAASGVFQMAAAGSGWVVTAFTWAAVEPQAPLNGVHVYDWSSVDAIMSTLRAADLKAFVLVTGNPVWAAQYPAGPLYPGHMTDLMAFLSAAAGRYPDVLYWSLYPEPDNGVEWKAAQGWGLWGNNGAGYADLLAQAAIAIKTGNPSAKLFISGIAYDHWMPPDGQGYFVKRFLDDVLQALNTSHGGAAQVIDGVAFHYYRLAFPRVQDKANAIRAIMTQYSAGHLPLWIPETGHASNMAGSSETIQAQQLVQLYTEALAGGVKMLGWLGPLDVDSGQNSIGLFHGNDLNQPKPAYFAYQIMTQELYGARYANTLNVSGAEAYTFVMLDGRVKTVVWGTQAAGPTNVPFVGNCISVHGILNSDQQMITDGSPADNDGIRNGQVALVVGYHQPLYVIGC